jgi:hypothetical protein
MSNSNFQRPGTETQAPQTVAEAQVQTGQTAPGATAKQGGIHGLLSQIGKQRTSQVTDGAMAALLENTAEITKADTADVELVQFNDSKLAVPGLAYVKRDAGKVYFFSLIPETLVTGNLANREETIRTQFGGDTRVEIDFPVSKCWNETYVNLTKAALAKKYSVQVESVVPVWYYGVDKSKDISTRAFAAQAYDTAAHALHEKIDPSPVVTADLLKHNSLETVVTTDIQTGGNLTLSDGEVVAADAVISTVISEKSSDDSDIHNGAQSLPLNHTAVKFDILRTPMQTPAGMYPNAPVPEYNAVLAITGSEGFDLASKDVVENPMTHIMSILSTCLLASGENWHSLFTAPGRPGIERKSLGLLGYEYEPFRHLPHTPAEKKVEYTLQATQKDSITFRSLVDAYFIPQSVTLAIDIAMGTRGSWSMQLLNAAANRLPGANEALIAYLDKVTAGHFSTLWNQTDGDGYIFQPGTCIIQNGYYLDGQDAKHDIRRIDYLRLLDVLKDTAADPNSGLLDFTEGHFLGATDGGEGLIRLHTRREVQKQIEPTATITGLSERRMFAPMFAKVAVAAMAQAGINLSPRGMADIETTSQLAKGFVAGVAADFAQTNQVFRQQFNNANGNAGVGHAAGPIYY